MADDDFDDFDDDGIARDAAGYQAPVRPSQRRAARKLTARIERVLAINPAIRTGDVRRILENNRNRKSGLLPDTVTFNREFARICGEVRDRIKGVKGANRLARSAGRAQHASFPTVASGASQPTTINKSAGGFEAPPITRVPVPATHPIEIYAGNFGGLVYKHGPLIRDFFSAIEKRRDNATLKALALAVEQDATSRARLADLHPKDRSIFEAALALP